MYDGSICELISDAINRHGKSGRIALVGGESVVTYAEFDAMLGNYLSGFRSLNAEQGETVAISCSNSPYAIAAFFGGMSAGLCPIIVDTKLSHAALADLITAIGVRHLITDSASGVAAGTCGRLQVHMLDSLKL